MKQKLIFSIFLLATLISGCNNGGNNLTKADSLNITKKMITTKQFKPLNYFQKAVIGIAPPQRIPDPATVTTMINCYKNYPLLHNPETHTDIQFIILDSADWDSLLVLNKTKPIKSLYFQFGIKNCDAVTAETEDPVYNIITMPVFKATGQTDLNYAYDFGCPCPGSPCCPK
jgi:hypothetical protein